MVDQDGGGYMTGKPVLEADEIGNLQAPSTPRMPAAEKLNL